ncbi:hypothetical protein APHAL10511_007299 [Amanita phalloides]|nr:hypothetical protein APHAL10511_007299 [Amanita phalloides]
MSPKRTSSPVPDEWDNDEWEEAEDEEENRRIWDEANTKSQAPMPSIISSTHPLPPPAAFQPALRILKRPSPTPPSAPSSASTQDPSDLKDREARYQAARDRIFGTLAPSPPPPVRVVRAPRGPTDNQTNEPGQTAKGFAQRGGSQPAAAAPSASSKQ